ncbi:glycoside hydrolase family 3 N-terminal domain-containing protein [Pseudoflavonifractor sp.]|jgi:beta-glucosidase|uniref:glycoside hydrolase family 3 N-terminal domain-containing protein n=1 Tax=Pseudoflavonifractor sp. TaxID=1980281 RepID=UPI003D8F2120
MEKKTSAPVRRPRKAAMAVMCVVTALLLVVNAAAAVLIPPNVTMINNFFNKGPSEAETAEAGEASAAMTQEVASEGIILLDNKNSALPLAQGSKVNLFGYGSRDTVYGGSGSGSGDESNNVTMAQGLTNAGFEVNQELVDFYDAHFVERTGVGYTGNNFDINEPPVSEYSQELLDNAKAFSDVALVVISRLGGEGADLPLDMTPSESEVGSSGAATSVGVQGGDPGKHYLELQQVEIDMLNMVKENFGTVVVLINSANTMELGFLEEDDVDAALWLGCLGSTGCNALGQVLSGGVNPSGRTTSTFAYAVESAPSYYSFGDYDYTNVTYTNTSPISANTEPDAYHYVDYVEGIYVGYRYYETAAADGFINYDETVQYPFGYGLSYTTFTQEIADFRDDGTTIAMDVTVTNTGDAAGKDVVQVYYTAPYTPGGIEKSHVVLVGFGKTGTLQPGESETITISFTYEDMASYDYTGVKAQGGAYVLEQGEYEIKLMNNSHDVIDSRTVTVAQDVIYNDANDGPRSTDGTAAVNLFDDVTWGEDVTYVSRADWAGTMPTQRAPQSREASAEIVSALTDTSVPSDPDATDITFADNGLTLSDMKGLAYDDPQWDKLLEQVTVEEMANLIANGGWCTQAVPSVDKENYTETDGPNGINNIMAGVTGTQYTGQSVLGCTWNQELAGRMGVTFAQEAIAYNISGLYAPGLNIFRSHFSGRNYEYFSEDGLHTGKMAAAEIQGIQSQGVYCYSKHFAVNDQETNRDQGGLCTWLNEQAMREVYLRGFELAVKEGHTQGMMAAFNRLGTTNCAENSNLLTQVLRNEWGFQGTVITDCIMQLSYIDADRCVRAGCDLQLSLMGLNSLGEETTGTTDGRQAMRSATHNILYMTANSDAAQICQPYVPYWLYITAGVVDVVLLGLCVAYFIRRHQKMKAWKAANQ